MKRVITFIDNSNVFKRITDLKKIDPLWTKNYDPKFLSERLTGNRELVKVLFYCTPPPSYLQREFPEKYRHQLQYYEAVGGLEDVEIKFGRLVGHKDDLKEKDLDTKISSHLISMAYENMYDVAIVVSCDGDYRSPIEIVRNLNKRVENAYFKGFVSMSLKQSCDISRRLRRSYFQPLPY